MSDKQLLNWAANQLLKASKTIDLLASNPERLPDSLGCRMVAALILRKLKKEKKHELFRKTHGTSFK